MIKNVSEVKKKQLNILIKQQGYTSISEFFRKVIDEVVSQNNIEFLVNESVLQNLIDLNNSVKLLTEVSNKNVENTSEVKKVLLQLLNELR